MKTKEIEKNAAYEIRDREKLCGSKSRAKTNSNPNAIKEGRDRQ
jgi:hypothetical protein